MTAAAVLVLAALIAPHVIGAWRGVRIDLRRRQAPPSLADQARSEFYRKWDRLLEAVGF